MDNSEKNPLALGAAVRRLRELRGWSQEFMCERLLASRPPLRMNSGQLSKRESGETRIKPVEWRSFAAAFGLRIEEFEREWRGSRIDLVREEPGIPVINCAPAGVVVDYAEYGTDSGQGHKYVARGDIHDDLAFAVQVVGDSMEPAMSAGDILIFTPLGVPKPRAELKDGESVVFVRIGPGAKVPGCTIARWGGAKDGVATLLKDNPRHKTIRCSMAEIERLAVCIELRTKRV